MLQRKTIHVAQGNVKKSACAVFLVRILVQRFCYLVRSLCVCPCAVSLCVILCDVRWPEVCGPGDVRWPEVCGPGNHNTDACLKVLVRVLVRALCVHCALLVDASVQVNGMNHCMSETSCDPCAILVQFPCAEQFRILVRAPTQFCTRKLDFLVRSLCGFFLG